MGEYGCPGHSKGVSRSEMFLLFLSRSPRAFLLSLLSCLERGTRGIYFNESVFASRRHDVQLEDFLILSEGRILSSC
ncbi:hypothetical protein MHYP_G00207670 [Metynnis hypsauchen]